jgi:tetratricopeptide (TPR) repeat protein
VAWWTDHPQGTEIKERGYSMKDSKGITPRTPGGGHEKPVMGLKKGLEPKNFLKKKAGPGEEVAEEDDDQASKKGVPKPVIGDLGDDAEEILAGLNEKIAADPKNEELHLSRYGLLKKMGDKDLLLEALEEAAHFASNPLFAGKLAELYEERFKYDKALLWRKKVVTLKPEDSHALKRLAIANVRVFKFSDAEDIYDKIFMQDSDGDDIVGHTFFQEMQGVGVAKERRQEVQQFGLRIAQKALSLNPGSVALLEGMARLARVTREMESAIYAYEELLEQDVKEHASYRQWKAELLRIYAREGYADKWKELNASLIEDYKQFLETNPADANAWLQLALQQIQAGFFEDAIQALKQSITADEKNVQALYELGRILVRLDRSEEAISYYRTIVPDDTELASRMKYHRALELCLADLFYRLGKYEEALSLYRREENANARYMGIVYEAMGKDKEALAYYKKALEISTRDGRNFLALAEYYVRRNMWRDAEEAALDGLESPHVTKEAMEGLYVALATTMMKTKRIEEAGQVMDEALEASPDLVNMHLRRMKLYFLLGKMKEGKKEGEEIIKRVERQLKCAPSASDIWSVLGDCSSMLGRLEKAHDAYTQAMKFNAMDSEAVRGLGVLAEKAGDLGKAIELFSRFVLLEPLSLSTPPLREKIKQLKEKQSQ